MVNITKKNLGLLKDELHKAANLASANFKNDDNESLEKNIQTLRLDFEDLDKKSEEFLGFNDLDSVVLNLLEEAKCINKMNKLHNDYLHEKISRGIG